MRNVSDTSNSDQRARDGRLAWIIVGCCAAVTVTLVAVLAYALGGSATRMVAQGARPVITTPPRTAPAPPPTTDNRTYDVVAAAPPAGGGQVQKRSAPAREAPPPPRTGRAELGEVQKRGATAENEAGKSRDEDDAPAASRGRDTPQAPAEPENPAHTARRI